MNTKFEVEMGQFDRFALRETFYTDGEDRGYRGSAQRIGFAVVDLIIGRPRRC